MADAYPTRTNDSLLKRQVLVDEEEGAAGTEVERDLEENEAMSVIIATKTVISPENVLTLLKGLNVKARTVAVSSVMKRDTKKLTVHRGVTANEADLHVHAQEVLAEEAKEEGILDPLEDVIPVQEVYLLGTAK